LTAQRTRESVGRRSGAFDPADTARHQMHRVLHWRRMLPLLEGGYRLRLSI